LLAGVGGVWTWTSPRVEPTLPRTLLVIFLIAMGLQIAAYFWVNLHRDSQAQGRYLLPAAPIVILLLASALRRLSRARSARLVGNRVGGGMLAVLGFCGLLAVPVYVHLNGFVHYVLPFYKPDYYHRLDAESFSPLPKGWHDVVLTNRLQLSDLRQPSVLVKSSGNDPWLMLDREHSVLFAHGVLVRVTLESQANGTFSVYWDEGMGMNEALSARRHFNIGYQTIYLPLATDDPEVIRLDPLIGAGNLIIHEIAVARLEREPLTVLRFLRQWLGFAEADVTAWQRGS
ncbi:MAG: hypothetical protein OES09_11105, partial [Gammaproteobacteria bacterium]|nr:hypothetical protein [Gammaproteobacteria bacterium]